MEIRRLTMKKTNTLPAYVKMSLDTGRDLAPIQNLTTLAAAAEKLYHHLSRFEALELTTWTKDETSAPIFYLEVEDSRKTYPTNMRLLLSWNSRTCKFCQGQLCYGFARRGWQRLAEEIAGRNLPHYEG
jgi:hypothetical protein